MVTGSRHWDNETIMHDAFRELAYHTLVAVGGGENPITVVHGNQFGADKMAGRIAEEYGFTVVPYPPDKQYPSPYRYHKRNDDMLEIAGLVWAFFKLSAENAGTSSVVKKAEDKELRVMRFETP